MSKNIALVSLLISLVALAVSIICIIDTKDDMVCSVSYEPSFSVDDSIQS